MSYLSAADFRTATLAEYCKGLAISAADASDADLSSTIARMSRRVDDATNDRFESFSATYELDGGGRPRLVLPQRCTAVATVKTRDNLGNLTTQPTTVWRLVSSLTETATRPISSVDYLAVIPGNQLSGLNSWDWTYCWPQGPQTVQVVGSFGWTTTPTDIKRATALLVWDHVKALDPARRSATTWATIDTNYVTTEGGPSWLREANDILGSYRRPPVPF
jgi:hypothetical protein